MVVLLKNYYSSLDLIKLLLLSKKPWTSIETVSFNILSNVKQLVVLVRLMGYIQLNGHVWGDSKLGYFHDLVSSVLFTDSFWYARSTTI